MKKRHQERLKDIIVDHIFHYCYNEIVRKIEGEDTSITLDEGSKIENDPVLKKIYDNLLAKKGPIKMYYDTRNTTHCVVIDDREVNQSFLEMLLAQGFSRREDLHRDIEEALDFLVHRSYISRDLPIKKKLTLTEKGLNHYRTGLSFEDQFSKGKNARIAIIVSFISVTIAIVALVFK